MVFVLKATIVKADGCRPSMIFTLRTCGFHSFAILQIFSPRKWKFMRPATLGGSFVSVPFISYILLFRLFLGASMSLVGLVPPLSDNGNMLVDGGYRE